MTYAELLSQLQLLTEEELQNQIILFDLYKQDGYDDAQFDRENLTISFGED